MIFEYSPPLPGAAFYYAVVDAAAALTTAGFVATGVILRGGEELWARTGSPAADAETKRIVDASIARAAGGGRTAWNSGPADLWRASHVDAPLYAVFK